MTRGSCYNVLLIPVSTIWRNSPGTYVQFINFDALFLNSSYIICEGAQEKGPTYEAGM